MFTSPDAKKYAARGVALAAIANEAKKKDQKGDSPLEVQTFINGARRELARRLPDTQRMGEATQAAKKFREDNGLEGRAYGQGFATNFK